MKKLKEEIIKYFNKVDSTSIRNLSICLKKSSGQIVEALMQLAEEKKVKTRQLNCGMVVWELRK